MEVKKSHIFQKITPKGIWRTFDFRPESPFLAVKQIHGTKVASSDQIDKNHQFNPPLQPTDELSHQNMLEADGLYALWDDWKKPLAIKTADCLPILIEGEKGASLIHAGWRGLYKGILKKAEISSLKPRYAFIGPSIRQCCFEVTAEFKNYFPDISSSHFATRKGKLFFHLQNEAIQQLKEKFPQIQVEDSLLCTYCHSNFHSYRKNQTIHRNWNLYDKKDS